MAFRFFALKLSTAGKDEKPIDGWAIEQKKPPWWRGTTAAFYEMMRQPGEGDEAAALSGLGGGRAFDPDSAKNCRCVIFGARKVAFQGHEDYIFVTNP